MVSEYACHTPSLVPEPASTYSLPPALSNHWSCPLSYQPISQDTPVPTEASESTRSLTPTTRAMIMMVDDELYNPTKSDEVYRVQAEENRATHCPDTASHDALGLASVA